MRPWIKNLLLVTLALAAFYYLDPASWRPWKGPGWQDTELGMRRGAEQARTDAEDAWGILSPEMRKQRAEQAEEMEHDRVEKFGR